MGITEIKLAVLAALLLGAAGAASIVTHKVDQGRYEALVASYAQAQAKGLQAALDEQKRQDQIATAAAEREAAQQQELAAKTQHQLAQVRRHVQSIGHCLTWGAVRVLVAGGRGRLPDDLSLPANVIDSSCAPSEWATVLAGVVSDYGTARQNAAQLDALSAWFKASRRP
ncbi:MAG: hypothetical protein ACREDH_15550 [Methylocella sp.]